MVSDDAEEDNGLKDSSEFSWYSQEPALLTSSQRAYLRGDSNIEKKSAHERSVRSRIRGRLSQSISDLELLHTSAQPRDIEKAFDTSDLFNWVPAALALIFDGLARASTNPGGTEADNSETIEMFESFIERAMDRLHAKRGIELDEIDVTIDIEFGRDADEVAEKDLDELSIDELILLLKSDQISQEEFTSEIKDRDNVVGVQT